MTVIMRNPSILTSQSMSFDGEDGMRLHGRGLLCSVGQIAPNTTGGVVNNGPVFDTIGMSNAQKEWTPPVTADYSNGGDAFGRLIVMHPAVLGSRALAFTNLFCLYRIRSLTIHYTPVCATSQTGNLALAIVSTRSGATNFAETISLNGESDILQLSHSGTTNWWSAQPTLATYQSSEPTWFDCMQQASMETNYFSSAVQYPRTDTQLMLMGIQNVTSPAVSVLLGRVWVDYCIEYKSYCIPTNNLGPNIDLATPSSSSPSAVPGSSPSSISPSLRQPRR